MKSIGVSTSMLLVTVIAVDVACYLLLPGRLVRRFDGYRVGTGLASEAFGGHGRYPQGYFSSHPTRGFDITPNARGTHSVEGVGYPIWSNRFGCFDHSWNEVPPGYFYFAGDSSTWGYAPYEKKFASLFEERTGIPSFKCGVTHTGQLHQFETFQAIVHRVGALPKHVIVGYSTNDIANDYAHPHSIVVRGWLVDDVFLDAKNYSKVRVERDWIEEKIAAALSRRRVKAPTNGFWEAVRRILRQYSISAQIMNRAVYRARRALVSDSVEQSTGGGGVFHKGRLVTNIYSLERLQIRNGNLKYADTEFTAANRRALVAWREHAKVNNYQLTFLLVPHREIHDNVAFFAELKGFMQEKDIEYIDLAGELRALGANADQVYWQTDGHMSPNGNRLVADILVRRMAKEWP